MTHKRHSLGWLTLVVALSGCSFDHATAPAPTVARSASTSLALGNDFSCGVTTSGAAYCWGANNVGQGGNGTSFWLGYPVGVALPRTIASIAASESTVCALNTAGEASCWGLLPDGHDFPTNTATPETVESPTLFKALAVGDAFACGLDLAGHAYCWGVNGRGQLGVGDTLPRDTPTAVLGGLKFTQLSAGLAHACGATAGGTLYCWGDNSFGQAGFGRGSRQVSPWVVATSVPMRQVAAGSLHTCAVSFAGTAYCWGDNGVGELGDGTQQGHGTPVRIAGDLLFKSIATSRGNIAAGHTCGITVNDFAYCWGTNAYGEAGGPAETFCISAVAVACNTLAISVRSLGPVAALDVGTTHTCAILMTGTMECWGGNAQGQIGDGTRSNHRVPLAIPAILRFR